MSTTDHGTQKISHAYYEEITAINRNTRLMEILPRGVYSGGYLERVSDVEIRMTPAVVEIGDDDIQVRISTSVNATINNTTLDSGSISVTTPYIVLRWSYAATQVNYMEIHAIASVSAAQANDVVVGKILFSGSTITGFDYSERTFLNVQDVYLKPEVVGSGTTMYIRLRAGKVSTASGRVFIPEQLVGPFVAPSAPNSRVDLVYIDDDGSPQMYQGTPAVTPSAPTYGGKMVVAEVTIANGDTGITSSKIRDVRSFLTKPLVPDDSTITINSSGKMQANVTTVVPKWNVTVCNANNYTTPDQFVSPIATFSLPSFGSFCGTHLSYQNYWMFNNSVRFRMTVNSVGSNTKNLKLFAVDNRVYVYVDSVLVFSRTTRYASTSSPINVSIPMINGQRVIDMVFSDTGGDDAYLNILGDIVDGTNVKFVG